MQIVKANKSHITDVSRLFDLYRQFYDCDPDIALATRFITERIDKQQSDIFLLLEKEMPCGFVQLYPSFCSVAAEKIFILYDLFVAADQRRRGMGEALLEQAHDWARQEGASRIDLLTAHANLAAQKLYEKAGYIRVLEDFQPYSLEL